MAIVDFHEHHAMGKDPWGIKRSFCLFGNKLPVRYKDYPNEVLFEICNEPNMKDYHME